MDDCPLVMLEWEDSRRAQSDWIHLSEFTPGNAVRCVSVGWMIHDGSNVKVLAPNMGDVGDGDAELQVSGVIHIPARCVMKITTLIETA